MKKSSVRVRSVNLLVDFCYFSSCEVGNTRDRVRTQEPIIDFQVAFLLTYDNLIFLTRTLEKTLCSDNPRQNTKWTSWLSTQKPKKIVHFISLGDCKVPVRVELHVHGRRKRLRLTKLKAHHMCGQIMFTFSKYIF